MMRRCGVRLAAREMIGLALAAAVAGAALVGCAGNKDDLGFTPERVTPVVPPGPPPAAIARMLDEISPLRLRRDVDTLAAFGTRHTLSETDSPTRGVGAAREWIRREFQTIADASGRSGDEALRVSFDRYPIKPDGKRITRDAEIVNVVCVIPGADAASRSRLIYMTGHYDSICNDPTDPLCDAPGANDNASGTAALLEAARVLSTRRFPATIVLVATAGEEQGLYGARLHAERARAENAAIEAVFNNDIVGDPLGDLYGGTLTADAQFALGTVRVFCEGIPAQSGARNTPDTLRSIQQLGGENDSPARGLGRYIAEVAARHSLPVRPLLIYRADRFLRGGDHSAFLEQGFGAAVRFTAFREDYTRQHQKVRVETVGDETKTATLGATVTREPRRREVRYGDLPQYVNEQYLANVTRVNVGAMAHLAMAAPAPEKARIITANLTTDTTIRWAAPPGPSSGAGAQVAGYEILVRDTTSPVWQKAIDVGMRTEATVPISKDNVHFGVRSYTGDGYRSLVAFPTAARE